MKRGILIIVLCMASIHGNTEAKGTDSTTTKDPSGLSGYFGISYNSVEYDNWFSPFGTSATTAGLNLGLSYTLKKDKHDFLASLYQNYIEYESASIKYKYADMLVLNFSYSYDINKSIKPVGILHVRTIATETTSDLQIGSGTGVTLAKPFDPAYIFGGLGVEYNGFKNLSIKISKKE